MADVKLDIPNTQDCADQLRSSSAAMEEALNAAASILNNAAGEMSGQLQSDSQTLYQTIQKNSAAMAADVSSAASTLDEMVNLLQTADRRGAAAFGAS